MSHAPRIWAIEVCTHVTRKPNPNQEAESDMPDSPAASASSLPDTKKSTRFQLRDLLRFEKMLTPRLARIGYYVLSAIAILVGTIAIINGASSRFGGGAQVIGGIATALLGPFLIRIACEQIIVIFGIHERLGEIRDNQK
jgi:hypothetical protein